MANPHNIKVGQEVVLLKIGHNKAYKSQPFDEANIVSATVTKIGRLYFTVRYGTHSHETVDFALDTLYEREENANWRHYQFFFSREDIERLREKERLSERVNKFLEKYRYGLRYTHDVSMSEVQLWIEFIEKVEALKVDNK